MKGIIKYSYKQSGKAIYDYSMLADKDRILVGFSGGKDSVALLKLLLMRRQRVPIDFKIIVCLVNIDFLGIDCDRVISHCADLDLPCVVKDLKLNDDNNTGCFWCSWNRRKILFETARDYNCNKIALGHNRDDIIETTLMNIFFAGQISTMRPKVSLFDGELKIIRPLSYLENVMLKEFVDVSGESVFGQECPRENDSKRAKIQGLIKDMQQHCPQVKLNIFNSLKKIRKDYLL
jgi:tRNA 2-thiocytidine biosynthesis protein TtcA